MSEPRCLAALAARDEAALRRRAASLAQELRGGAPMAPAPPSDGLARLVAQAASDGELAERLDAFAAGVDAPELRSATAARGPRLAFAFAGQSGLRPESGRTLRETLRPFRATLEDCDLAFARAHGRPLSDSLHDAASLADATVAQPGLFALQLGLHELWAAWGATPQLVVGHSLGELAAAHAAGALAREQAIWFAVVRGALTQRHVRGGVMLAVLADAERVREALRADGGPVEVAAVNAPRLVAISGPAADVERAGAALEAQGVATSPLETTHAFHSACVNPLLGPLEQAAAQLAPSPARIAFASTVAGRLLAPGERLDAAYWRRHAREPVRFLDAVRALAEVGCEVVLELGPDATLARLGPRCAPERGLRWVPSLRRGADERGALLDAAVALWLAGVAIDLGRAARDLGHRAIAPSADAQAVRPPSTTSVAPVT